MLCSCTFPWNVRNLSHINVKLHIQGNCTLEPSAMSLGLSAPDLRARKAGQCILVTDTTLIEVSQHLWLDNLYIRQKQTTATNATRRNVHVACIYGTCNLWMTSVTLQGAKKAIIGSRAILAYGGKLFASGAGDARPSCIGAVLSKKIFISLMCTRKAFTAIRGKRKRLLS
jgi:hypothetical protein